MSFNNLKPINAEESRQRKQQGSLAATVATPQPSISNDWVLKGNPNNNNNRFYKSVDATLQTMPSNDNNDAIYFGSANNSNDFYLSQTINDMNTFPFKNQGLLNQGGFEQPSADCNDELSGFAMPIPSFPGFGGLKQQNIFNENNNLDASKMDKEICPVPSLLMQELNVNISNKNSELEIVPSYVNKRQCLSTVTKVDEIMADLPKMLKNEFNEISLSMDDVEDINNTMDVCSNLKFGNAYEILGNVYLNNENIGFGFSFFKSNNSYDESVCEVRRMSGGCIEFQKFYKKITHLFAKKYKNVKYYFNSQVITIPPTKEEIKRENMTNQNETEFTNNNEDILDIPNPFENNNYYQRLTVEELNNFTQILKDGYHNEIMTVLTVLCDACQKSTENCHLISKNSNLVNVLLESLENTNDTHFARCSLTILYACVDTTAFTLSQECVAKISMQLLENWSTLILGHIIRLLACLCQKANVLTFTNLSQSQTFLSQLNKVNKQLMTDINAENTFLTQNMFDSIVRTTQTCN